MVGFLFKDALFQWFMSGVPEDVQTRSGDLVDGFKISISLATHFGIFFTLPVFTYQVYAFVRPALRSKEDRAMKVFLGGAFALVFFAVAFTHQVLPHLVLALLEFLPEGVLVQADILSYLSVILTLYLGFAIVFQFPLVVFVSIVMEMVDAKVYRENRRWVVVVMLVLCAIFSPPDIQSQLLIFTPLYLLFEFALLAGALLRKRRV